MNTCEYTPVSIIAADTMQEVGFFYTTGCGASGGPAKGEISNGDICELCGREIHVVAAETIESERG